MSRNRNNSNNSNQQSKGGKFMLSMPSPLVQSTCNVPFSVRLGDVLNFGRNAQGTQLNKASIPGVMQLDYIPTIGIASDWTAPVNRAAADEYAFVVHKNSRNTEYESADLMLYYISVSSLYAYYYHMCRVYKVARKYIATNQYTPEYILSALRVNRSLCKGDKLASFLSYINSFAMQISRFRVPAKFNLLPTWCKLASNIFKDDPNDAKAQFYVPSPGGFYMYEPYVDRKGGKVVLQYMDPYFVEGGMTLDSFVRLGTDLLNHIQEEQDIGTMMGDVEKAYGTANCFKCELLDAEASLDFVYNEDFGAMLNNAVINTLGATPIEITQTDSVLHQSITLDFKKDAWYFNDTTRYLINDFSQPSPDRLYDITQFITTRVGDKITSCGPAVLTGLKCFNLHDSVDDSVWINCFVDLTDAEIDPIAVFRNLTVKDKFKFAPRMYIATRVENEYQLIGFTGDVNTYATISSANVLEINQARNMADIGFGTVVYERTR